MKQRWIVEVESEHGLGGVEEAIIDCIEDGWPLQNAIAKPSVRVLQDKVAERDSTTLGEGCSGECDYEYGREGQVCHCHERVQALLARTKHGNCIRAGRLRFVQRQQNRSPKPSKQRHAWMRFRRWRGSWQ